MHIQRTDISKTQIKLTISAAEASLTPIKDAVLKKLAPGVKIQGFRGGKAPIGLIEKNIDPQLLQSEFLDEAMTVLYMQASQQEKVRPVTRPDVQIKKFVPFTELEFDVTTGIIGPVELPDYKKIKAKKSNVQVTDKDVQDVIDSLKVRLADKVEVSRASKDSDQVWIDFKGVDDKGEPIQGADGKDYPLVLGSKTFIPGFEDNVIGLKVGDEKTFTLTFPKDYGVKALASKKVTFTVNVTKVEEVQQPKEDDEFAKKAGPFQSLTDLKEDIKKQLTIEREKESITNHQDEVLRAVVAKSSVEFPDELVQQQIDGNMDELQRNLSYRGQSLPDYLASEGKTEEEYKAEVVKPQAENQLKTSLVLAEIADKEGLAVTPEELEIRIQILKGQYQDEAMQAELEKDENRRDISSRMLTEKVLEILTKE